MASQGKNWSAVLLGPSSFSRWGVLHVSPLLVEVETRMSLLPRPASAHEMTMAPVLAFVTMLVVLSSRILVCGMLAGIFLNLLTCVCFDHVLPPSSDFWKKRMDRV